MHLENLFYFFKSGKTDGDLHHDTVIKYRRRKKFIPLFPITNTSYLRAILGVYPKHGGTITRGCNYHG